MHNTYLLVEARINGVAYPPINLGVCIPPRLTTLGNWLSSGGLRSTT
jgi:hypothetical protein